jgi:hypothetical protein
VARARSIPTMLGIACVVVCFAAMGGALFAQQQTSGTANEKTVLRGTVVNSVTHQPIGRALVKSTDGRFATMTNDRGRFEMVFKEKKNDSPGAPNLPGGTPAWFSTGAGTTVGNNAGAVTAGAGGQAQQMTVDRPDFLTAKRVGFLKQQTSWGEAIPVARDQDEVTISLTPEAKVVGHVTLADGEGAAGMPLELYRQAVSEGRVRWVNAGSVQARSDGEFRFADLEAGIYKLYSAELPDRDPVTSDPRGQGYGYPPDYYPSAADFAGGVVIHLAAGETFQANLTPEKRRYYPVHIGVNNGGRGQQFEIEVERDGHPGPGFTLGPDFRDGSIGGMLPEGNYLVRISTQSSNALTGVVNLSVRGGPAESMVTLLPGTDVEVRVNEEFGNSGEVERAQRDITVQPGGESHGGSAKQLKPALIRLQLVRAEEFGQGHVYMAQPPGDPQAEGLVIPNVTAGEYQVSVQTMQLGHVAAVRSGDTDLQNSNLVVGGGSSVPAIEVTLRDDGGEIDGSIVELANRGTGDGYPPAGFVYFVPVGSGRGMKLFVAQPNGDFQAAQLPPGTYRVLAFERPKNDLEYANDDAMRKYDAQMVTVLPGQKTKIRVSLSVE